MKTALLISSIFLIGIFVSVFIIKASHKAETEHISGFNQPGYEKIPDAYTVYASPSYRWSHGTGGTWKLIVAPIVLMIGFFYNGYLNSQAKSTSVWYCVLTVVIAYIILLGSHAFTYYNPNSKKQFMITNITPENYHTHEADLDKLFPQP